MATDNPRAVDDQTLAPKDRLNGVVFYISALIILIFSITTILFNDFANRTLNTVLAWVSSTFSWYYYSQRLCTWFLSFLLPVLAMATSN